MPIVPRRRKPTPGDIRFFYWACDDLFEARYTVSGRVYRHPDEASSFVHLRRSRGQWLGEIEIQEFAETLHKVRAEILATLDSMNEPIPTPEYVAQRVSIMGRRPRVK